MEDLTCIHHRVCRSAFTAVLSPLFLRGALGVCALLLMTHEEARETRRSVTGAPGRRWSGASPGRARPVIALRAAGRPAWPPWAAAWQRRQPPGGSGCRDEPASTVKGQWLALHGERSAACAATSRSLPHIPEERRTQERATSDSLGMGDVLTGGVLSSRALRARTGRAERSTAAGSTGVAALKTRRAAPDCPRGFCGGSPHPAPTLAAGSTAGRHQSGAVA